MFPSSKISVTVPNNYSVTCLSPLQYPGGKVWLMPHIRQWLLITRPKVLIEPFAGGAIVSLASVMERLVPHAILIELDKDVAAFWRTLLMDPEWLAKKIVEFKPSYKRIKKIVESNPSCLRDHGFRTLIHNRAAYGGNIFNGSYKKSSLFKKWYSMSWWKQIIGVGRIVPLLSFHEGNCLQLLPDLLKMHKDAAVFVDPPYSASGGKQAGKELYRHSSVDHAAIFELLANSNANFLMTYDTADEIIDLVRRYEFKAVHVSMKSGTNKWRQELIITRNSMFENEDMNKINLFG